MRKIILMMSVSLDGFFEGPAHELAWTLVDDGPQEGMERKAQPGGDMGLGGADLAASFMRHDLIDEYRIYVHPVVIGRGKPLFPASDAKIDLKLVETRTFGNGVVLLRYQ